MTKVTLEYAFENETSRRNRGRRTSSLDFSSGCEGSSAEQQSCSSLHPDAVHWKRQGLIGTSQNENLNCCPTVSRWPAIPRAVALGSPGPAAHPSLAG